MRSLHIVHNVDRPIQGVYKMLGHNLRGRAQQPGDFNHFDFYLWRHLESLVYSAPIENKEALHQRMFDTCQTVCKLRGNSEMV
jgi:hypothetical protein